MGKSRSATICIAYLLHQQRNDSSFTPQAALELVREGRPLCEPNDGFMQQLELYHEMGCPEDVTDQPIYQRWLYRREVEESVACGRAPEIGSVRFEDEQPSVQQTQPNADRDVEIKCRKCRFVYLSERRIDWPVRETRKKANFSNRRGIATSKYIISHEQEKRENAKANSRVECAHIFLHPMKWMRSSLYPEASDSNPNAQYTGDAPLSGRLTCPNRTCGANIGKFAWQGLQCNCNSWVVPAIGLAKSRVDIKPRVSGNVPPAALGIRLPPGMRPAEPNNPGSGRGNL